MDKVRFPGFYKLGIGERLKQDQEQGWIGKEDLDYLKPFPKLVTRDVK